MFPDYLVFALYMIVDLNACYTVSEEATIKEDSKVDISAMESWAGSYKYKSRSSSDRTPNLSTSSERTPILSTKLKNKTITREKLQSRPK